MSSTTQHPISEHPKPIAPRVAVVKACQPAARQRVLRLASHTVATSSRRRGASQAPTSNRSFYESLAWAKYSPILVPLQGQREYCLDRKSFRSPYILRPASPSFIDTPTSHP